MTDKLLNDTHKLDALSQEDIIAASISTINKILVKKGIVTIDELKEEFQDGLKEQGITLDKRTQDES